LSYLCSELLTSQPILPEAGTAPKVEITSLIASSSTADETLEDDEYVDLIVLGPSPAQISANEETVTSKKTGKRPVRGKN
jgi:hypothetical protein